MNGCPREKNSAGCGERFNGLCRFVALGFQAVGFVANDEIEIKLREAGEGFDYFFVVGYEDLVGRAEVEVAEVGVCIEDEDSDTFFT